MEVIVTLLLCTTAFLLYLLNKNRNEISELKAEIHRLKQSDNAAPDSPPVDKNTFVSVIFKESDKKFYDYFLGDNSDVQVGDFVEVYFNNKISGKTERRVAKVIYVSESGETSEYARSKIKRKTDRRKW